MAAGGGLALTICSLEEVFTPGTSKLSFLREHSPPSLHSQNTYLNILVFFTPRPLCFPTLVELVYLEAFLAWSLPLLEFFYEEKKRREQTV